jgi:hypothetical protein
MALALMMTVFSGPLYASGLLGDVVRAIPGGKKLGDDLDDAHRKLKQAVPPYGRAEETVSGAVRKGFEELGGEAGGPALAEWIRASRANVINAGVRPIPPQIRQAVAGFVPEHILQKVRYRSGWGNEVALPALSFRFGDAAAITLDDIVCFAVSKTLRITPCYGRMS